MARNNFVISALIIFVYLYNLYIDRCVGNSFHMTRKLRLRIQRVNQCHFLLQHAFICLCLCVYPCLSIHIPHKFSFALFASFVVSHFQVFPYQSMHRLLIISRRHSCKIFVRISSQVQSMRIGSTKCGAHTHLLICVRVCVCVCFYYFKFTA